MREKLQNIPTWVIVVAAVLVLGLAGAFMFKTAQNNSSDGSYQAPPMNAAQQQRYQEEMMKRSGRGGGYRSSGQPGEGGRPSGNPGGGPPAGFRNTR